MTDKLIYSEIDHIEFYIPSEDEIKLSSSIEIKTPNVFKESMPDPNGVYDLRMGTSELDWECKTCKNNKKRCPGHHGHYQLNYPIISPLYFDIVISWLKVICHNCGNLLINLPSGIPKNRMLQEAVKKVKEENCPVCKYKNPKVFKSKVDIATVFYQEYKEKSKPAQLYPHQIGFILSKITDATLTKLGKTNKSHPKNIIKRIINIPPNIVRPDKKNVGDSKNNSVDDITILLQNIIKINNQISSKIPSPNQMSSDYIKNINNLNQVYYYLVKGKKSTKAKRGMITPLKRDLKSIAERMQRKKGRIRQNLLGGRVGKIARSVINCDVFIKIDEVGIPLYIAKSIQIEEVVTSYNYSRLNICYLNGKERYPGCTDIIKKNDRRLDVGYNVDKLHENNYQLQIGDKIYRDIINGDYCILNREPSLINTNSLALKVVVMPWSFTIRINVLQCPFFNADFDGDQMSAIFTSSIEIMNEISVLSTPQRFLISYQNSSPIIGEAQDSLIGSALMTNSAVHIDKFHAMNILSNIEISPDFTDKDKLTGRDLYSILFKEREYNINIVNKSKLYDEIYSPFIDYKHDDIFIEIKNGNFLSGIIDKSVIGEKVFASLFHLIYDKYNPNAALQASFDMQHIVLNYLFYNGFTFSIKDIIISEDAKQQIKKIESSIIDESLLIAEELKEDKIIPPINKTVAEYYEEKQLNAVEGNDDLMSPIFNSIDFYNNNFAMLIFSGSKGKPENLRSSVSAIGQILIGGSRAKKKLSGRTLPYITRSDENPISNGYIASSYVSGIRPMEFIFNAMDARISLIQIALGTSVSGEQNRNYIKNMESQIVNNLRQVKGTTKIIQPVYAYDGVDTRYMQYITFPTMDANTTDKEFEGRFHLKSSLFSKFNNKNVQKLLDDEFDKLKEDRKFYQDFFIEHERITGRIYKNKIMMPVNINHIINDIVDKNKESVEFDPVETIKIVNDLCDKISYALMNDNAANIELPEKFESATFMLRILIRSYLNMAIIKEKKISIKELELIVIQIYEDYKKSLLTYGTPIGIIAAQSLSEPMTQMALDSKHKAGLGVGKIKGMTPIKEIISVTEPEKLKSPTTILFVKPEYVNDIVKVRKIANNIEMLKLKRFVISWQILYEKDRIPVHPNIIDDKEIIASFKKYYITQQEPKDLLNWSIRLELNKNEMILKQIDIELIYEKLSKILSSDYIIYSPDNSTKLIIRIYLASSSFKKTEQINSATIGLYKDFIMDIVIRGVKGINSANVITISKNKKTESGKVEMEKNYAIVTSGININKLVENPYIDANYIQSDSVAEMYKFGGITVARKKIINELREQVDVNYKIYTNFADEMCILGYPTSIKRYGLVKREARRFMLPIAESAPIPNITNAAIENYKDTLHGISGKLIVGNPPEIGSAYNKIIIDEEFINQNLESIDNVIDTL
jgi:DNA-directed RNA polymerase II subunit RPB1